MPKKKPAAVADDYGLDDALDVVETAGKAKLEATLANKPPPKPKLHTAAEKALHKGLPVPLLVFDSAENLHNNTHAAALHHFYGVAWNARLDEMPVLAIEALTALETYPVTSGNTYGKALRRYREVLLASAKAQGADTDRLEVTPLPKRSRLPECSRLSDRQALPLDTPADTPVDTPKAKKGKAVPKKAVKSAAKTAKEADTA